ncbi:CDF family Co(II)/Ni(II) efflux transporter DmeF [Desulfospira joergensenii]|uniref:CDF family Co(II)/Ni(II) efflux transporter DmeF n=1 Tax=Desulfospira joergensenii TaxID=53329 RepID=UPI0003B774C3|nr:CDF family Co(II)/Ni(II) efflux transporter DmeF [Desulfospira joergensenii]
MNDNCTLLNKTPHSQHNEKLTLFVVIITLVTMVAEIAAGLISGSMALLSDGIHMGTHAMALFITLAAYIFARKHQDNPSFSFGTGKVGVLGGYTNALLLMIAGGAMAVESVERILHPVDILFDQAILVAVVGLVVNIISAVILGHGDSGHDHGDQGHERTGHHDHNLKAAYLHVITDAMTSVLAIAALLGAKFLGIVWADPLVGILGALVVMKWALGLLKQTSCVLLDRCAFPGEIESIRSVIESESTIVKDIHLWQISENERSLILSLSSSEDRPPGHYHKLVEKIGKYEHITVEINPGVV